MMRFSRSSRYSDMKRQRGVATLLIGIILLVATTVLTFSVARTSLMETRMVNNSYRAAEANQAAEAGLEYGYAWLAENLPTWVAGADGMESASPATAMPDIQTANGDTYSAAITYTRDPAAATFALVTAVATSTSDSSITATMRQYAAPDAGPLQPGLDAPPVVINGCLSSVTGNPDSYPEGYEGGAGTGPFGTAVGTSKPELKDNGDACIELGHLGINNGNLEYDMFTGSAWDYIFSKSRAEIKALADAEVAMGVPDNERRYVWVTSTSNYHQSWGSPSNPVVLIFAASANCPKVNGNPTIYGLVFVDSACDGANGWGGTTVYGSVVVDGDISKLTANTEFYHFSEASGGDLQFPPDKAPKILGTWSDF